MDVPLKLRTIDCPGAKLIGFGASAVPAAFKIAGSNGFAIADPAIQTINKPLNNNNNIFFIIYTPTFQIFYSTFWES